MLGSNKGINTPQNTAVRATSAPWPELVPTLTGYWVSKRTIVGVAVLENCQKYGPKVRTSQETTNSVNFLMSV